MAYDSLRNVTILFGGEYRPGTPSLLADTWKYHAGMSCSLLAKWRDDFEPYQIGSPPPAPWVPAGNRSSKIVTTSPASGQKCLEMRGQTNVTLADHIFHPIDPGTRAPVGDFFVEFWFRHGTERIQGGIPVRSSLDLAANQSLTPGSGRMIYLARPNGQLILADGNPRGLPLSPLAWHHMRVRYTRLPGGNVRLAYDLDFKPLATITVPPAPLEPQMVWLDFAAGAGTVWYDDIKVSGPFLTGSGILAPGATITFSLTAPCDGNAAYQMASSLGTGPIAVPGVGTIDLTFDVLFYVSALNFFPQTFVGYSGLLSGSGQAAAKLVVPNSPVWAGLRVHTAFVTYDSRGIRTISNTYSL